MTGFPDVKVILYKHDEIMKNLFKKYLERNKINFKFVQNFKELLRSFKVTIY